MGFNVGGIALTSPSGTTLSMDDGATNWMKVNADGILTRPQTPYFRGDLTVGSPNPYNGGGAALPLTAYANVGNCWNAGRFTCPVAGKYMVQAGSIAYQQAGYLYLRKNNVDIYMTHWNHMGGWHYVSLSAVAEAAVGDYFSWHLTGLTPATCGFYSGAGHAMYSIALMA